MPYVTVKGRKVHYLKMPAESAKNGQDIVFIHGSGGNAFLWQKMMEGLENECTSIAVDLPGHGESQGEGMKLISEYGDFLREFFDSLRLEKIVLAGHSLGGGIVQDFALKYPERLRAIVLIGTGARLRVFPEALERLRQMAEGQIEPEFEPWGFSPKASAEVLAEGKWEWAKTSSKVRYHDMMICDKFDMMEEVEKIRLPALIVCGREDLLTPIKYADFLSKKITGSKIEIIEGAGHMIMLEAPHLLNRAVLNFLRTL